MKSYVRLANDASADAEELLKAKRFLNKGYDDYVHGAYLTATELYHGGEHRFATSGVDYEERINVARVTVAGKLHEVVKALEFMALMPGMEDLRDEIGEARRTLDASDEY